MNFYTAVFISLFVGFLLNKNASSQSIDSTFAVNGYLPYGGVGSNGESNKGLGRCAAIQQDGKIVVGIDKANPNVSDLFFYTYRYNTDGTPDTAFGVNGVSKIFAGTNSKAYELQIQPDGKIAIIGETEYCVNGVCGAAQFIMMRLNPGGGLDSTFGDNGKIISTHLFGTSGTFAIGYRVKLLPNGKFIVAGRGSGSKPFVARLHADGFPDNAFGQNGIYSDTLTYYKFADLDTDEQGGVGLLLQSYHYSNSWPDSFNLSSNYLVRLTPNGVREPLFGNGGLAEFDVVNDDEPTALALKSDGSMLIAGNRWIASVTTAGALSTFPPGGYVPFDVPGAENILIQKITPINDNRFMLAGYTIMWDNNYKEIAFLAQVDGSGNLLLDFNQTGLMQFDYGQVGTTSGWTGKLCAFFDVDVLANGIAFATGHRNAAAGSTQRALFVIKLTGVPQGNAVTDGNLITVSAATHVYPNPASAFVTIETDGDSFFEIKALSGHNVQRGILLKGRTTVALQDVPAGLYLVRTTNTQTGETLVRKLAVH